MSTSILTLYPHNHQATDPDGRTVATWTDTTPGAVAYCQNPYLVAA